MKQRSDWAINKNIDKRIKELGGSGGMAQHSNEYHDPDMALATHAHDATYAPIAKGVTGGDAHDHVGGDGAQIDHTGLANKGTNTHAQVDTHLAASAPHSGHETPAGAQAKVDAHKDLTTGIHGVGASTVESVSGSQAKVDAHKDLATGVHGAGASTLETVAGSQAKVDTHKGADVSATVHPNANTHIGASTPHSGHVQVAGQIGGTAASPDVRGIRETGGPTLLTLGAIADTQFLVRSGTTIVGSAGGGGGLGYAINVQALTSSPADGATVYFGMMPKAPVTTANISKVYVRKAGTIKIVEIYCYSGTAGSAESWSLYIRKNNTTDTLIATLAVSANERQFSNTGLSIAMAVGDYFEIKGVQPTWATNPLTTIYGGYVYIE